MVWTENVLTFYAPSLIGGKIVQLSVVQADILPCMNKAMLFLFMLMFCRMFSSLILTFIVKMLGCQFLSVLILISVIYLC